MKLYILRHAHALNTLEAGVKRDEDRPLSAMGLEQARAIARCLIKRKGDPRKIVTSPFQRAVKTAQEVSKIVKPKDGVALFEPLSNKISGSDLLQKLNAEYSAYPELLVVGHQPQLGEMVVALINRELILNPCSLVAIDITLGNASFLWSENPSS